MTSADEFVWIDSHNRLVEVTTLSSYIIVVLTVIVNLIVIVIFGFFIAIIVPFLTRCNSCLGPVTT